MLKEQLQADLKAALKAGDANRRTTIGMALSVVKSRELEKRSGLSKSVTDPAELEKQSQLTDDEIIQVVSSEIKKRKEAIATYEQGGRAELAQKEKEEIAMLSQYLPEQMTPEALTAVVDEVIAELKPQSPKEMGKVIAAVMAKVKGRADGQTVSALIKERIGK